MRKWANDHSKCVTQRKIGEETTKLTVGTLPLNMYETSVQRGKKLVFAPNEDKVQCDDEREH